MHYGPVFLFVIFYFNFLSTNKFVLFCFVSYYFFSWFAFSLESEFDVSMLWYIRTIMRDTKMKCILIYRSLFHVTSPIYRTCSYKAWKAGVVWWCQCWQTLTMVSRVLQTLCPAHFPLFFCLDCSSHFSSCCSCMCCCLCCRPWNEKQEPCSILFGLYFNISLSGWC